MQSSRRDDGVDAPGPEIHGAGRVLNADRTDLGLAVLALEDNAVVVVGLGMDDFAQIESRSGQSYSRSMASILSM